MHERNGEQVGQAVMASGAGKRHDTASPGRLSDAECFHRAQMRGQSTFTVVAQDRSAPRIVCEWIKENIETCPRAKLFEALSRAIEMRDFHFRKTAD